MARVEEPVGGVATDGVRVRLLGPFEVEGVDLRALRSRKARTLLKVLALAEGRPVTVDRLIDCLWGDEAPARPEREVAVNASRARAVLGADVLERTDGGYQLRASWSDVATLAELEREAQRRLEIGDHAAARSAAVAGLALARGELLADEADPTWAETERATVDRRLTELRRVSARAALAAGALDAAAADAHEALDRDPFDEVALRVLMTAQAAAGRPASALAAYAEARARLAEELGVDPTAETEALHTAILREETLPGVGSVAGSARRTAAHLEAALPPTVPPGRTAELAELGATFASLGDRPVLVVVEGEPGAGKTTVLDAFAAVVGAGSIVLRGSCDEAGIDLPLQPIADALAAHLATHGRAERVDLLGGDAPVLAGLLGLTAEPVTALPGPTGTTEALQAMLFAAVARLIRRLAADDRVVLVLDDVHRAGASTRAWVQYMTRRGDVSLLIVAGRRTGEGPPLPADITVAVGPLDLEAARQIVGDERAASLLERAGGNALFLVELAAAAGEDSSVALPASVRAAVVARAAEAGDDVAATLRAAALLGPTIDLDLLAAVLRQSPLELLDHLECGVTQRILEERGSELAFRHALVREALEADVGATRRALLHREAHRVLVDRPGSDPLVIASHARQAGDLGLAAQALASAAEVAVGRFDLAEAEALLTEAISLDEAPGLLLRRGRVRLARADLDGANADAMSAADRAAGAEALELRAWVARLRHDMPSAIAIGEEGARIADDPLVASSCLIAVGIAHRGLGDLGLSEERLVSAGSLDPDDRLGAAEWVGVLRVHQGRPDEALGVLEQAAGREVELIHGFWLEHVLQMTAHAYALVGRVADALATLDRLDREMVRRGSDVRYAGLVDNYRSWILRSLGDESAVDVARHALEIITMQEPRAQAALELADSHLLAGDLDEAAARLASAGELMGIQWFQHRWRSEQRLGMLRAYLALASGEPDDAWEHAAAVRDVAEARGDERYAVLARLAVARAGARRGDPPDPDDVALDLAALPGIAALEAWRLTAWTARDLDVDAWWPLAESCAARLATGLRSGGEIERAEAFEVHARAWLDDLRV